MEQRIVKNNTELEQVEELLLIVISLCRNVDQINRTMNNARRVFT
jgi:hypothetical protein